MTGSTLLANQGCQVDTARDPDTGLQQMDARVYDVIVVQAGPETESWQLCEKIRHLSRLPVIVISRNASAETCVRAINAGADYFMRKPFGPLEFIARVQSLLQRKPFRQPAPVGS